MNNTYNEFLNEMVINGMYVRSTCGALLEAARRNCSIKIKNYKCKTTNALGKHGTAVTDPIPKFLKDTDKKYNIYLFDGKQDFLNASNKEAYEMFMVNIGDIEDTLRECLLKYFEDNKSTIVKTFRKNNSKNDVFYKMINTYKFDKDTIDELFIPGWITIGDCGRGNLDLYVGCIDNTVLAINIISNGRLDYEFNDINTLHEAATFKNISMHEDYALITCNGRVKKFLGDKNKDFIIWLTHTYEIQEVQKERYREFMEKYEYFDNIVTEAMLTYYKMKYRDIQKSCSKIRCKSKEDGPYNLYCIDKEQIRELCTLSRLDLDRSGSVQVTVKTEWDEYISIQLYNVMVPLTNTFSLPMCGSKFGKLKD